MAGILGLAHIGVYVGDLAVSKAFYHDKLDFDIIWECEVGTNKVAFAQKGDLVLELIEPADKSCKPSGVVEHIAMRVKDIAAEAEALKAKGIVFDTENIEGSERVFPNGAKWILFYGPDGEHLELNEVL